MFLPFLNVKMNIIVPEQDNVDIFRLKNIAVFKVHLRFGLYTVIRNGGQHMSYQAVFKRYEIKFLLDKRQREALIKVMDGRLRPDEYGRTVIRNIYFDTDDHRLIRTSLDKPVYKEKLRIRSYKRITGDEAVFVELKKKYESIVYKRRIAIPETSAMQWLADGGAQPGYSQIENEIEYFREFYKGLAPRVFLSYEREAFYPVDGSDIRITLDSDVIGRQTALSLREGVYGSRILEEGKSILEVKVSEAMPMWLIRFLRENSIYKASYSKYGMYYSEYIFGKERKEGLKYA